MGKRWIDTFKPASVTYSYPDIGIRENGVGLAIDYDSEIYVTRLVQARRVYRICRQIMYRRGIALGIVGGTNLRKFCELQMGRLKCYGHVINRRKKE